MSPEKKTDPDKLHVTDAPSLQSVLGTGTGSMMSAQEVVQLLTQILSQVRDSTAHSVFKPAPLGPEAVAAVNAFRLIRVALEYPARDRAQIPSTSTVSRSGGASPTGIPVAQGV